MDGKVYGGGGHKTKKAAIAAREQRKLQVKQGLASGSGKQTPTDTGFREAARMYLTRNKRRKGERYKVKKKRGERTDLTSPHFEQKLAAAKRLGKE